MHIDIPNVQVTVKGACVVVGVHVWLLGGRGHAWLAGGCIGYDEIRSMSGRYASYWNAFLFYIIHVYCQPYPTTVPLFLEYVGPLDGLSLFN